MEAIVKQLAFLDIPLNVVDLTKPEPHTIQRIYRTFLIKAFGIPEQSLIQPDLSWSTPEMQRDPDLYNRAESNLLLLRFVQSILTDCLHLSDDTPLFSLSALIDPKPRETRQFLSQLIEIHQVKQINRGYYENEEYQLNAQVIAADQMEERADALEKQLQKMKDARNGRMRLQHQLRETREKRAQQLVELTKTAAKADARNEAQEAEIKKMAESIKAKEESLAGLENKDHDLAYDIVDDPTALKLEVEANRQQQLRDQQLLAEEGKQCDELRERSEQCARAQQAMLAIEAEFTAAKPIFAQLNGALQEAADRQTTLEESKLALVAKREGVKKKAAERAWAKGIHEEDRKAEAERQSEAATAIGAVRAECAAMRAREGAVKESVSEARRRLNGLKDEKSGLIQTTAEHMKERADFLATMEAKVQAKSASLAQLHAEYQRGMAILRDSMTTPVELDADGDTSITQTMQLLDSSIIDNL